MSEFILLGLDPPSAALTVTRSNITSWTVRNGSGGFLVNGNIVPFNLIERFVDTDSYDLTITGGKAFFDVAGEIRETQTFRGLFADIPRGGAKRTPKEEIRTIRDLRKFFRPPNITILGDALTLPVSSLPISTPLREPFTEQSFFFVELKYKRGETPKRRYQILEQGKEGIALSRKSLYGELEEESIDIDQHTLFYRQISPIDGAQEDIRIARFTPQFRDEDLIEQLKMLQIRKRFSEEAEKNFLRNLAGAPEPSNVEEWLEANKSKF